MCVLVQSSLQTCLHMFLIVLVAGVQLGGGEKRGEEERGEREGWVGREEVEGNVGRRECKQCRV